jgi:predicted dehydrogenase
VKILVVGLGSIARRHIRNLSSIDSSIQIGVWRQNSRSADLGEFSPLVTNIFYGAENTCEWQPDAALVTNPAPMHIETGLLLASNGTHLFIEKPLSDTLEGVDELLALCRQRDLVLLIGYPFRFCKSLQVMHRALIEGKIGRPLSIRAEVGQYLPDWRPDSDYRQTVSARRDLGGGAVLELSHELDYVRWLLGEVKSVSAHLARTSDLEIDVEDTAEITLQFANKAVGSIHVDMVQRAATRVCRVVGTEGTLRWDGLSNRVQIFSAASYVWEDLLQANTADRNDMYKEELSHFIDCILGKAEPMVNGQDGKRVLEIALAAKQSSQDRRVVEV